MKSSPMATIDVEHPGVAEPAGGYGGAPLMCWVQALVDCPGAQGLFLYRQSPEQAIQPGDILSVPFGAQQVGAIAIQVLATPPAEVELDLAAVREVEEVICRGFFPASYWALLQQVSDYYATPLMQVIKVALPPGLLGRSQRRVRLTRLAPAEISGDISAPAQAILALLLRRGDYTWNYLHQQVPGASRALKELMRQGWVESYMEPATAVRPKQRQAVTLAAVAPPTPLSSRQQEVIDVLRRSGGDLWLQELLQRCCTSSSTVQTLAQKGWVILQSREVLRTESGAELQPDLPKPLTPHQSQALAAIAQLHGPTCVLLHGVTGSGKTEVYLQAIATILQRGQSALVLVPEIGLTPQLTDRFRARFGTRVRVYHSALSEGERYDTWRQMLGGGPQVVIGTRSAVFAPLPNLGLIVLDEEHDDSFKQEQPMPCYHARTVAQWRSQQAQCPLILGSATPSLESWVMAHGSESRLSKLESPNPRHPSLYLSLPERVQDRAMPTLEVIDLRQELSAGNRSLFSRSLHTALEQLQTRHEQAILFIPRRGHSTFVSCRSCGTAIECPHCDITLAYHQPYPERPGTLRCHYCGFGRSLPPICPTCQSPYLKPFGSGTQKVMESLAEQFPELRCLRFDSDTTRNKGMHRALLQRFGQGDADVLVGTQMLTKGIDLPRVTLVGVMAADGLLHLPDYRASERAFQILTQVAGRAGRGEQPGRVIVQTYSPEHPVIQAIQQMDYATFINLELAQRQVLSYPPTGQMVLLRLSGVDSALVRQTAQQVVDALNRLLPPELPCDVMGPAPALIPRVARRYRWHVVLKGAPQFSRLLPDLMPLRSLCPASVNLSIDIDPTQLM